MILIHFFHELVLSASLDDLFNPMIDRDFDFNLCFFNWPIHTPNHYHPPRNFKCYCFSILDGSFLIRSLNLSCE